MRLLVGERSQYESVSPPSLTAMTSSKYATRPWHTGPPHLLKKKILCDCDVPFLAKAREKKQKLIHHCSVTPAYGDNLFVARQTLEVPVGLAPRPHAIVTVHVPARLHGVRQRRRVAGTCRAPRPRGGPVVHTTGPPDAFSHPKQPSGWNYVLGEESGGEAVEARRVDEWQKEQGQIGEFLPHELPVEILERYHAKHVGLLVHESGL